ncbi:MAG: hypothetical protein ACR2H1_11365, partial [Limisphaerales bacterium]
MKIRIVLKVTLLSAGVLVGNLRAFGQEQAALSLRSATPTDSVLLLGDPTVARTKNLRLKFFPTKKHP